MTGSIPYAKATMTDKTEVEARIAAFLKERDEALFTGDGWDGTDEERAVSARKILALTTPPPAGASDICQMHGCVHAQDGCPKWPEGSNPFAPPHTGDTGEAVAGDHADYDAGLLNDFGGGNVDWWWDYLRAEIGRANDFWRAQVARPSDAALRGRVAEAVAAEREACADAIVSVVQAPGNFERSEDYMLGFAAGANYTADRNAAAIRAHTGGET